MCIRHTAALIFLLGNWPAWSQSNPEFEVATVKLWTPPRGDSININLGAFQGGRFAMDNVTLSDAIKFAYSIVSDEQLAGADWNSTVRFDIVGLTNPDTPVDQLRLMLRALLAQRLHLVLRSEQRTLRYLALVPGKDGPKLKRATPGVPAVKGPQVRGHIEHYQMPMSGLATLLSRFERQTVVDRTGLEGPCEVMLQWAPDNALTQGAAADASPDSRPNLFEAVQQQLGLKLEPGRGPLEVLVVEQASKVPEEN